MAYGLSASADGNVFPWIFNPPVTYWDGASAFIKHVADKEGGFDKLKGKKIGLDPSRRALRQGADPAARGARQGLRLRAEALSGRRRRHAEPGLALARHPPRPAGLDLHPGLGRDEPDRRQGSGQEQLPDGASWSASGGPAATTTRAPAAKAPRATRRSNFHAVGTELPGHPGHPQARRRQGQEHGRRRTRSARTSTTAASTTRC